jgi:hypothetical protein
MQTNNDNVEASKRTRGVPTPPEAIYALGMLGAWVWFWQQADGFWEHGWALVQGVLWPAFMVFEGFSALS